MGGELLQPRNLGRPARRFHVAVQGIDLPGPAGVSAKPGVRRAGIRAEVSEVGGIRRSIVVVAWCGPRPAFLPAPDRVVTVQKFFGGTVVVGDVAGGEDGALLTVEQAARCRGAPGATDPDVSGADEHRHDIGTRGGRRPCTTAA